MLIYDQYLEPSDKGYVYNSQKGKLTSANSQPVDISLIFTCRLIAKELKAFAFGSRTINFATSHSAALSKRAEGFFRLLDALYKKEESMFYGLCPHLAPEFNEHVMFKFPSFAPFLDPSCNNERDLSRGYYVGIDDDGGESDQAPPEYREAIAYTLRTALDYYGTELIDGVLGDEDSCASQELLDILQLPHEPWLIPTSRQLNQMAEVLLSGRRMKEWRESQKRVTRYYRFSAAAVAIRFLHSLPKHTRLSIRNIRVHEDRPCKAMAASHAKGFIPFCQENPLLRVQRCVNLWQTGLLSDGNIPFPDIETSLQPHLDLDAMRARQSVAAWVIEAQALVLAGMPAQSFSLLVDGEPAGEQCSTFFEKHIKRACMWQEAMEEHWKKGRIRCPSFFKKAEIPLYTYGGFPQLMKRVVNGWPLIRCNFDLGKPWDVEELVEERTHWSLDDWSTEWWNVEPGGFSDGLFVAAGTLQVGDVLPDWVYNVWEHFDSKWEG